MDAKEPLKVTFTFTSPIVKDSEYPIFLDALLSWCVNDEAESLGAPDPWETADDLSHLLDSHASQAGWVWKASALIFTPSSERFMMNMVRRCDPLVYLHGYDHGYIEARRKRNVIYSGSGQERAYQFLTPYQWMKKAESWCIGDREMISEALMRLRYIGKRGRNGFGTIRAVTVEPDSTAEIRWKLRVLPKDMEGMPDIEYVYGLHCLRAPYWKKTNRILAKEPILL